ncbi:MAG: YcjX family protein [Thiomargarita sp.]|nr:YcjX family protein [Thiomargarita sp.]
MKKWLPRSSTTLNERINRTLDKQVKLAVTGLSRSGKTVFITSLVHQLLHGLQATRLPFFKMVNNGRLRGTKVMPQPDMHIPAFRYDLAIEQLCGEPPAWPQPTNGISEIRLAIRYLSNNPLLKHFSSIGTLYVDIIDYPGEWLLDLPLLELSYEQWSAQITQLCKIEPRLSLSEEWRAFISQVDLNTEADSAILRQASELYTDFLHQCKSPKYGLSLLQPGRFTMPGDDLKNAPLLEFCPLLNIPEDMKDDGKSFYSQMKKRYESYKERVIKPFYKEHFASFDRQIVLADVLKTFQTSYASFVDMRNAINMVLESFQYGKSGLINKLFGLNIDKILFAATKADHITPDQLPNLENFLQNMLATSHNNVIFEGVHTETLALAAVKCTQAAYTIFEGKRISCIKGMPVVGDKPIALFPGQIPTDILMPEQWVKERFHFIDFKPPRLANIHGSGLPHIRLDRALEFLLGDKF